MTENGAKMTILQFWRRVFATLWCDKN